MPSLTPIVEGAKTLTALAEAAESLVALVEGTEILSALTELSDFIGFFPDTALYSAPYPFPSATSYPGDQMGVSLIGITEATETLTPLSEV